MPDGSTFAPRKADSSAHYSPCEFTCVRGPTWAISRSAAPAHGPARLICRWKCVTIISEAYLQTLQGHSYQGIQWTERSLRALAPEERKKTSNNDGLNCNRLSTGNRPRHASTGPPSPMYTFGDILRCRGDVAWSRASRSWRRLGT